MDTRDISRPRALPFGPRMLPLPIEDVGAPEWQAARDAVEQAHALHPAAWPALGACHTVEVYAHASMPPGPAGDQIGFAALVVGYARGFDRAGPLRPAPAACVEIAGRVAAHPYDTRAISGNRGHLAALLTALAALCRVEWRRDAARRIDVWSNSAYVAQCANGARRQGKNVDLWLACDGLLRELPQAMLDRLAILRVDEHARSHHNRAAEKLAAGVALDTRLGPRTPARTIGGRASAQKRAAPPVPAPSADTEARGLAAPGQTEQGEVMRDDAEGRLDALRALGVSPGPLPLLSGSTEKRTRWAMKIRVDALDDIGAEYRRFRDRLDARQRDGGAAPEETAQQQQWCDRCVARVLAQADPEWWIDKRACRGWELVRLAFRELEP